MARPPRDDSYDPGPWWRPPVGPAFASALAFCFSVAGGVLLCAAIGGAFIVFGLAGAR